MRFFLLIAILLLGLNSVNAQNSLPQQKEDLPIRGCDFFEVIDSLAAYYSVTFSYVNAIIPQDYKQPKNYKQVKLSEVLNDICSRNHLVWMNYNGKIIFRKAKRTERHYYIKGVVKEANVKSSIPFASVYLKNSKRGIATDNEGEFELRISEAELFDTVIVSYLGFKRNAVSVEKLLRTSFYTILLEESAFNIKSVDVKARRFKTKDIGNTAPIPVGSLYLDTHGQQVALMVENKKHTAGGYIYSVNFHLSKKGNAEAPFRVRLLYKDSITGKPGEDMFPEIVIVKPHKGHRGWYKVNLRQYKIKVPKEGFYAVMQGVYPEDYEVDAFDESDSEEYGDDSETGKFEDANISYGQRIGYTRSRKFKNNTWHYSLSHRWFQLRKQKHAVMINATIKYSN